MFFFVSDIHGNFPALRKLMLGAGLIDYHDNLTQLGNDTTIISVGDLLNAVLSDVNNDMECAIVARKWFDKLILGNHESPYLGIGPVFNGYYESPPLKSVYNSFYKDGFVVPSMCIGNTLVTHAGWALQDGITALQVHKMIAKAWETYPKNSSYIFDAIGYRRGGMTRTGGILWSDVNEPKNKKFSQVFGHTPIPKGPLHSIRADGTFTLMFDTGCEGGGFPTGVWLDDDGNYVSHINFPNS